MTEQATQQLIVTAARTQGMVRWILVFECGGIDCFTSVVRMDDATDHVKGHLQACGHNTDDLDILFRVVVVP